MKNINLLLLFLILFSSFFLSGCITESDSDNDGVADKADSFPNDARYHSDSDGDGYADKVDDFPNDARYHSDSDGDGYADKVDDFPNDARYHSDSDGDGYADKIDDFLNDARYHSDSDGDGFADEIDDFPNDARYHSDYDKDGFADEIDSFPSNSLYHATCSICDGSGNIYSDYERNVQFIEDGHYSNVGVFNPDYYLYSTVTNIDTNSGIFEIHGWATDNGVKMWEEYQSFVIDSGDSHEFVFHYDADEEMDAFYSSVTPPTYIETIKEKCYNCDGAGKV